MGRTFAVALVASALSLAGVAYADPGLDPDDAEPGPGPDGKPADAPVVKDAKVAKKWLGAAQQLVAKADGLAKKGKADDAKAAYDNAITAYGKAIEAGEDPNVPVALAQLEDRLGRLPDAIKTYKLAAAAKGLRADVAKQVAAKLDAALAKVGLVTFVVQPEGATISIDGAEVGKAPLAEPLVLMPGTYKLAIASTAYVTKEQEITVEAGSESERKVELEAAPAEVHVTHEEVAVAPARPPHKPSLLPIYVGGAATVVTLGGAIILGVRAIQQHNLFVAPNTLPNDRLDAQDNGKQYAHAADICTGLAIASAAFTGGWYWFKYRGRLVTDDADDAINPNAPKLVLAPWVQPGVGGLAAAGHF